MNIDQHFTLKLEEETSLEDILPLLKELSTGLINHSQWIKVLHRTLICNGEPQENDLSEEAHHLCKFGKWYYSLSDSNFKDDSGFIETGALHIEVHNKARELLKDKLSGKAISSKTYDDFNDTANDFRVAVQNLQFSLISKVCAVDHLTGVWNRHAMSSMINKEHERARRTGNGCALAIMDFDDFKQINDKHGHVAGDRVLKTAVDFFVRRLRKYDVIFRYGGDEFLLLFPETDIEHASQLLERLRTELKNMPIMISDSKKINVSVSIGMSEMDGQSTYNETIKLADHALIEAKSEGRGCVRVWNLD
ncbi:MAG: diguanylate cyclase [Gammaproteobacteria bacterium]|nr:diguanylate cyclase [Gammaproteobacteria bacterium]